MKSQGHTHLGLIGRQTASRLICTMRELDEVIAIPAADRRLDIYRRCLVDVQDNIFALQREFARARSLTKREHFDCAIEFRRKLERFFAARITTACSERF